MVQTIEIYRWLIVVDCFTDVAKDTNIRYQYRDFAREIKI